MKCKNCGQEIIPFFSLGEMPLVNALLKKEDIQHEKKFDLTVGFCPNCYLAQLLHTVAPEVLYRNYLYFSSVSTSFLEHCKNTAHRLSERLNLGPKSLVIEIASNDGAFLRYVKELNIPVLGVEPAENIAHVANERGIPTRPEFFNLAYAKKLQTEGIAADLVYGANVLAHVPEIIDFVRGLAVVLKVSGSAVFEFPYIQGLFEGKFDTIYHEHVFYYSVLALQNLFRNGGLELYDVEMIPVQGGSLRIFAALPGVYKVSENVLKMLEEERKNGWDKIDAYEAIAARANTVKGDLLKFLQAAKKENKKVAAYSAAAKGAVLLNFCGVGKDHIDFLVDKSPAKQGLYTPGTHFLIGPPEKVSEEKPDHLLILAWNIAEEVMAMEELKGFREADGKFLIPIPEIKIIKA